MKFSVCLYSVRFSPDLEILTYLFEIHSTPGGANQVNFFGNFVISFALALQMHCSSQRCFKSLH